MKAPKKASSAREQTLRSFRDKWTQNPDLAYRQTLDPRSEVQKWILSRNGFKSRTAAKAALGKYKTILDAGCGNGRVSALLADLAPHANVLGIDQADVRIAAKNTEGTARLTYQRADLTKSLRQFGQFDFIYCQEVLHHTGQPKRAFGNLVDLLSPSGKIAIYVYRKKAPAREFMDDYVRGKVSSLPYRQAILVSREIAELGRRLARLKGSIKVNDIPVLGIEKGTYSAQRLVYNFFLKCYWNESLSATENAAINYDWYHPQHSSRHTMAEVLSWFSAHGLRVTWKNEDLYGITVHGQRRR